MRISPAGNVGIGTSSPGARLQVNAPGTSRVYTSSVLDFSNIHLDGVTPSTTTSALTFSSSNGGGAAVAFSRDNAFGTFIGFWTNSAASANAATERLRIDNSGRVGIGTSSPGYKLEVFGTSNANEIRSSDGTTIGQWYQDSGGISIFGTVSNHPLAFRTNSSERMRIDSSGRLLVGTSTSINNLLDAAVQIAGTSTDSYLSVTRFSSVAGDPAGIILGRSKSATKGVNTAVSNGDYLGAISFSGANGTSYTQAASIGAEVDGAVTGGGAGDMPGRLVFSTTADGASSPTERIRITNAGNVLINTSNEAGKLCVSAPIATQTGQRVALFSGTTTGDLSFEAVGISKFDNNSTTSQIFQRFYINSGTIGCGQINANGASTVAFGTFSDARLKENIVNLPSQLQNIRNLRPVEFDYKDGSGHQIGFVAQEMQEIYPDVVAEGVDGMLTITGWSKTEARLVKALQEAIAKIETLEAKVAALEGN
jgi:hypothetical protein